MNVFKKILFYSDIVVFYWIIVFFAEVSLKIILGKEKTLLNDRLGKIKVKKSRQKEKIEKYVSFFFYVKSRFGRKEYCFVRSLVLYSVLRKHGYNASIKFKVLKESERTDSLYSVVGHCWVAVDEEKSNSNENLIFQFP